MKAIRTGGLMLLAVALAVIDPLYQLFRQAMQACSTKRRALPRVIKFSAHPWVKRGHSKTLAGGRSQGFVQLVGAAAVIALVLIGALLLAHPHAAAALAITPAAGTTRDLAQIMKEGKELQEKYQGKAWPKEDAEKFEALLSEGKAMQDDADRKRRFSGLEKFADEVDEPLLPESKGRGAGGDDEMVGYITVGEAFTASPEYQKLREMGFPEQATTSAAFKGAAMLRGVKRVPPGVIAVSRKQLEQVKAVMTTTGSNVIRPMRESEIVRLYTAEHDKLTIRDLVNVSQTDSNSVEYLTLDYTRAAATVADQATKAEATGAFALAAAPVRTLAVWMPVTEQQLQDVPQIQNTIDTELTYDLSKKEEEEIMWGRGTGTELLGIMKTTGVAAGRTVGGDTLLDKIRRAMSDVRVVGRAEPNGLAIHPYDNEALQLLKATTNEYIWAVVTDAQGPRIWGLRVVETIATTDVLDLVNTTQQRVCLIGDFVRGATLWDRMQSSVAVGYVNDNFIKNMRTIRAEERVAFGVKRPKAFRYIETVAAA